MVLAFSRSLHEPFPFGIFINAAFAIDFLQKFSCSFYIDLT